MPRLLAPSISSTSTSSPVAIAMADVALVARRRASGRRSQLSALARIRARRGLADAAGTGEQVGVPDAIGFDRVLQRLGDMLLADQLVKAAGTVATGNDRALLSEASWLSGDSDINSVVREVDGNGQPKPQASFLLAGGDPHTKLHRLWLLQLRPDQVHDSQSQGPPPASKIDRGNPAV